MLYIVLMCRLETEYLEKENLFYGTQRGSNAGVFLHHKTSSKVTLKFQKIKGCHSPLSPGLVSPPQPESPKNRGSMCTWRTFASDLPRCPKRCQNARSELGKHMVWSRGPVGRFSMSISCKHRRRTHTQHCNPHIYCLCSFFCGQNLQCSKTQWWANTDLWSVL